MKKSSITRFAKTAVGVSKMTKRPITYSASNGHHIIACDYFFLRTDNNALAQSILAKIPEIRVNRNDIISAGVDAMVADTNNLKQLTDSGIVAEGQYGFRRFLFCEEFATAVNDDYLYIFEGEKKMILCKGVNQPVLVYSPGAEYIAGILPLRHRSNEAALATMHRLIVRSGYRPRKEA